MFSFPFKLTAPDVIIAELKEPNGQTLVSMGLQSIELSGEQVLEVMELAVRYPAPSRADLFALVLAKASAGVLLTGDNHLRRAAKYEEVPVYGMLWLLDEFVEHHLTTPSEAAQALKIMLAKRRRLPPKESEQRLRRWENQMEEG